MTHYAKWQLFKKRQPNTGHALQLAIVGFYWGHSKTQWLGLTTSGEMTNSCHSHAERVPWLTNCDCTSTIIRERHICVISEDDRPHRLAFYFDCRISTRDSNQQSWDEKSTRLNSNTVSYDTHKTRDQNKLNVIKASLVRLFVSRSAAGLPNSCFRLGISLFKIPGSIAIVYCLHQKSIYKALLVLLIARSVIVSVGRGREGGGSLCPPPQERNSWPRSGLSLESRVQ